MARFEGKFDADGGQPIEFEEILGLMVANAPDRPAALEHARACYLSSSDGWRDAVKELGGAFADIGDAVVGHEK